MTGGDLKIEVLPAGAVVPAFGLLDAVSKGRLDGGHGVLVYHYGKNTALALWGSGPGYAMDANMLLAWHKYGGGKALLEKIFRDDRRQRRFVPVCAALHAAARLVQEADAPTSDDFKGLKYRTVGISIDLFTAMGAAVNALPGGEIVAAIDRGLLDAAEFNNASSGPRARLRRRLQGLHAAELSPERRAARDQLQQDQVQRVAGEDEGDHRRRGRSLLAGHDVEGDRPQLAGLHHAADDGQGEVLQDAGCDPQAAARALRRDHQEVRRRQIRCSRRSSNRSSPSPSGRRSGSRTTSSAARWRSTTTSGRTRNRRSDGLSKRQSTIPPGKRNGALFFPTLHRITATNNERPKRSCTRSTASAPGSARPRPG